MASQLLPLGTTGRSKPEDMLRIFTELIDKCVGSKIWVILKNGYGKLLESSRAL
jgi:hypothetical protein